MVTAVKDGSDGVASVIRGFGAGNEGKSAVKTLGCLVLLKSVLAGAVF